MRPPPDGAAPASAAPDTLCVGYARHRIFPATRAAIDTLLGPLCVGRDPSQILVLNDEVQRVLHGVGRSGPTIYALSGIDIALWDIAGRGVSI